MRITVFGATGGTGKQLVGQALAEGDEVVAFARKPSKLNVMDKNLTIVQGELTDEALIENAVKSADAVISVLGPRRGSRTKPLTQGMHNIIDAMKKQGVRRLIISSILSTKDPNDLSEFRAKASSKLRKSHDACCIRRNSQALQKLYAHPQILIGQSCE